MKRFFLLTLSLIFLAGFKSNDLDYVLDKINEVVGEEVIFEEDVSTDYYTGKDSVLLKSEYGNVFLYSGSSSEVEKVYLFGAPRERLLEVLDLIGIDPMENDKVMRLLSSNEYCDGLYYEVVDNVMVDVSKRKDETYLMRLYFDLSDFMLLIQISSYKKVALGCPIESLNP